MLFQFGKFSSLLLIFFVHGLVYALLLWRKAVRQDAGSERWLSLFLLLCILYITPWMVGFAGWYDAQPYRDILFYVPFQHLYLIGPVIFFYVQSLLNPGFRFGKRHLWHLLPGALYLLLSAAIVVTDKLVLKRYYFLANGQDPDFDSWYQLSGFLSMFIYFLLSLRYYIVYRRLMVQVVSYADGLLFRWVRNFLLAFLCMLLVRAGFYIAEWVRPLTYVNTWWYFLAFALIYYYMAIMGYANATETKFAYRAPLLGHSPVLLLGPVQDHKAPLTEEAVWVPAEEAKAPEPELDIWKEKLLDLVQDQRAFEAPELTLTEVAQRLGSNPSQISLVINRGFGVNFNDFVNRYRVEAVVRALQKGEHLRQTLLSIGFECGFNSKATFNRAFKKHTGLSPRDWLRQSGSNAPAA